MEHLWAPWRHQYITKKPPPTPGDNCFICNGLEQDHDRENILVHRGEHCAVFLNRFPYNNGHLLVAPNRHTGEVTDLSDAEHLDIAKTTARMVRALQALIAPEGFNCGLNIGRVAGAGLPGHLHWHIVPRWNGDTNFMSVTTEARVIIQSLDSMWEMLTEHLKAG